MHNPELTFSEVDNVKGIAEANFTVAKIASGIEKLLSEISTARVAIRKALRAFLQGARTSSNEILVKLEILQNERENLRHKLKNVEDDNKGLEDENVSLARELSSLKAGKEKMSLQVQDLEKEIGTLQDDLAGLRDENRRLLKEAKWKSVGKQGGYQESLVIKEWEKKLEKLEDDYANLRKEKKVDTLCIMSTRILVRLMIYVYHHAITLAFEDSVLAKFILSELRISPTMTHLKLII